MGSERKVRDRESTRQQQSSTGEHYAAAEYHRIALSSSRIAQGRTMQQQNSTGEHYAAAEEQRRALCSSRIAQESTMQQQNSTG